MIWWLACVHQPRMQFDPRPEAHLRIPPHADARRVREIARFLPDGTVPEELSAIHRWMADVLVFNPDRAYRWRDAEEMLAEGNYGGCADHAFLFGAIARAMGIPTVWVKSMDEDFIREFLDKDGDVRSWRGHVYLEVWDGRWRLYDATNDRLYDGSFEHALPGGRWAYDVGDDPHAMVMSTQWEPWKRQSRRYLAGFDAAQLRPPQEEAYIAADWPYWKLLSDHLDEAGLPVRTSFNADWDAQLANVAGEHLFVVTVGDELVLPDDRWPAWTGLEAAAFRASVQGKDTARVDHAMPDGTQVTVLWAADEDEARAMIGGL